MELAKPKIRMIGAGACALGFMLVVCGCSATHPTAMWSARPVFNDQDRTSAMGSSSSVVFSPGLSGSSGAVVLGRGPGFDRNDDLLATRDRSLRDQMLELPQERLSTLDRRRVYRGSRRADEYVYPGEARGRDRGYRGYRRYRRYP